MTSQVQYHFHNVSARDLLVKGRPNRMIENKCKKNLFCFVFQFLFCFCKNHNLYMQAHYLGKPLYTNNESVLLPSKAVKVFKIHKLQQQVLVPIMLGKIKFGQYQNFMFKLIFGSSNTNRNIPSQQYPLMNKDQTSVHKERKGNERPSRRMKATTEKVSLTYWCTDDKRSNSV